MNENLPGFVVMLDPTGGPISGAKNWSSGYMPATYQGTIMRSKGAPIIDLNLPDGHDRARCSANCSTRCTTPTPSTWRPRADNSDLAARIASYELAYKMQQHAPEAVDLEPGDRRDAASSMASTRSARHDFGKRCLLARRLVERGVRFIQLYSGGNHNDSNWDAHGDLVKNHNFHAGNTDQPIAALLKDLKRRGLLDETLVVWGGEFGRQPTAEYAKGTGRDHNAYGFTMWMAGGGIQGRRQRRRDRRARRGRRRATVPRQASARHDSAPDGHRPESAVVLLRRSGSEARRRRTQSSRSGRLFSGGAFPRLMDEDELVAVQ